MRKAFIAGAWCVHSAVIEIGEPHITEQQGVESQLMETPIDRLRKCKLFGGNQTELAVYGGKWGVPNERDKNEVVRDYLEVSAHAKRLMDQVMQTWNPPLLTGSERPADIAQTSTMIASAYIMGREFLPSELLTDNQRIAVDSGLKFMKQVFGE